VATDLNNLAQLLRATNRLEEAEPLMRRHVVIFRTFGERTGYRHPRMYAAVRNYLGLLAAMGVPREEVIPKVMEASGLSPAQVTEALMGMMSDE